MTKNLIKISTKNMSHDEWLEHRRRSIGGSDASAIVGLNSWSSPYSVWAEKLGKLPPKEDNERMRLGRDLEDYVSKRFTEKTGKKVRKENSIISNPDYPFAHANVDRMIVGEDAGLECKTTSILNTKTFKNGEYPANYYVQCVHYMMVTGCKKWYLAVLVLGEGFYDYVIERDEAEIEALAKSEKDFWEYVIKQTPPATDGLDATTEAISTIYPESNDEVCDLALYETELRTYMDVTKQINELKVLKEESANKIKAFMGESGRGEGINYKVNFTTSTRSTFDAKSFEKDNPSMDLSKYYKTTTVRAFKVNEIKK